MGSLRRGLRPRLRRLSPRAQHSPMPTRQEAAWSDSRIRAQELDLVNLRAQRHSDNNRRAGPTGRTKRIEKQESYVPYTTASRQRRSDGRESRDELCKRQRKWSPSIKVGVGPLDARL